MKKGIPRDSFWSDPFWAQRRLIGGLDRAEISILDVGANKGQTARKYRSEFPAAEFYCFEPFPDSIAELQNQFSDDRKIHIVPKAVGRERGVATFFVTELDTTNSLSLRPATDGRYYPKSAGPKETIEIEVIDIDGFLKENNVSMIDIMKLDIQGGELEAMRGAESLLKAGSVSLIFTEIMFIPHFERSPLFHEI